MKYDNRKSVAFIFMTISRISGTTATGASIMNSYHALSFNILCDPPWWLVLVEHFLKRGKLVVSGGVARGRVARRAIGVTTPKDMTPQAQAQKPTQSGTRNREPQQGRRPLSVLED